MVGTLKPVADPGFPRGGGANSPGGGGRQHTILPKFPKNCMKLKEFGPPGGARPLRPPLDPPLQTLNAIIQFEENKAKVTKMVTLRSIRGTLQATKGTL